MKVVNRLVDLVLALFILVLVSPVLVTIIVVTKCHLRCHAIFKDNRIGKDGRQFGMYKITTMKPTPENLAMRKLGPITKHDPRISRFSHLLRRYSLDELPQLVNVIKGDMSLVGPRPELPHLVEQYASQLPQYKKRLQVLPGMSGLAQVYGFRKSHIEPERRLERDLYYVEHQSPWLYFWILLLTPWAVIKYEVW